MRATAKPEPLGRRVAEKELDRICVGRPPPERSLDDVAPQRDASDHAVIAVWERRAVDVRPGRGD